MPSTPLIVASLLSLSLKERLRKANRTMMPKLSKVVGRLNRDARHKGLVGDLKTAEWAMTLAHFHHRCAYCGGEYWSADHFIPQALRGMTSAGNLVPACWSCNQRKGPSYPDHCSWISPSALANIHAYLDPLLLRRETQQRMISSRLQMAKNQRTKRDCFN